MAFSPDVVKRAFVRQGGLCAHCGKNLTWDNRDKGELGAWHAHHRRQEGTIDSELAKNCIILCITRPNCHLNTGHGGNLERRRELSDAALPYMYAGQT